MKTSKNKRVLPLLISLCLMVSGCASRKSVTVEAPSVEDAPLQGQSISSMQAPDPAAEKAPTYEIDTAVYHQSDRNEIHMKYPQLFVKDGDPMLHEKINSLIEEELVRIFLTDQLAEVENSVQQGLDDSYSLELDYQITLQTDEILSILYSFDGGYRFSAYPSSGVSSLTIDLKTGEKLALSDFTAIDNKLLEALNQSDKVTNRALEDLITANDTTALTKEDLTSVTLDSLARDSLENEPILPYLEGYPDTLYGFNVTKDSLIISISVLHAAGDYALIEIPYPL